MTSDVPASATMPPDRPVRRRRRLLVRLLRWTLAVGLAGVLSLAGLAAWFWSQADTSNVGQLGFRNELKIPPLLQPRTDDTGRKVFDLRLQQDTSRFLPAKTTSASTRSARSAGSATRCWSTAPTTRIWTWAAGGCGCGC
jgi:hypothetical protein